ncbi:formylglycine-generating enzyme family protein [Flagellimonas algicola]|uniref:Formylglycine-generating enzyme family protein n=1 Tax=Flagellimonas algicola TaxID=2583815 RepID=A0ABY2WH32_9FLAO|nr:SUMF1/EgtB/PvdO family nonheme iron enzyme [Allomuricauda algicola]TMU50711.1 formylglycine-generating enzyme family protein [Allomuricauda algicola]
MKRNINNMITRLQNKLIFMGFVIGGIQSGNSQLPMKMDSTAYTQNISNSNISFDMVKIPGGTYDMGSETGNMDEKPLHKVKIDSIWAGKYEVTWEVFDLFLAENQNLFHAEPEGKLEKLDAISRPSPPFEDPSLGMGKAGFPVINISPYAALTFCKWLSTVTGRFYRLPTEAEWEYMCKTGPDGKDFFKEGGKGLDLFAWSYDNSDYQYSKVGEKLPNAHGLYDILGNVGEWTLDQYDETFYGKSKDSVSVNPWNIPTRLHPRVYRGGSWNDDVTDISPTKRSTSGPYLQKNDPQIPKSFWWYTDASYIGFRLVSPVKQPTEEEALKFWQIALDE